MNNRYTNETSSNLVHPTNGLFPPIEGEIFEALVADIRTHGLRERIAKYEGLILDGRARYRLCELVGVVPACIEYPGPDPLGFVLPADLHRQHLTESQRAMVGLANMKHGRPRR
jgi:hypothetical protein